jgi:hypothetical protein
MPDITLCTTLDCPLADSCMRKKFPATEHWQSYAAFDKEDCKFYWPEEEK